MRSSMHSSFPYRRQEQGLTKVKIWSQEFYPGVPDRCQGHEILAVFHCLASSVSWDLL